MTDRLSTPAPGSAEESIAMEPTVVDKPEAPTPSGPAGSRAPDVDAFIGRLLAGRYQVVRRLGTGGFGAVFEALDTKIHKRVAVKVLVRDLVGDAATLARFRQEAEAASQVGHENIIDITDFDHTDDGHYFMVMELLEGCDLGSLIRSGQQLVLGRMIGVLCQVCRALGAAHAKGILHRDLKPANIFLTARGSRPDFVKVLDFGISKFMEMDEKAGRLTKTGQIVGTPLYMAPEQALAEHPLDHRVDIYSLGIILYEILTGRPPFTASSYLGIIAAHTSEPPLSPSRMRPDLRIPAAIEKVALRAIAKSPDDRFASMAELEEALLRAGSAIDPAHFVSHAGHTPASIAAAARTGPGILPRAPRPRRLVLPLVVALGAIILGGVGWVAFRGRTVRPVTVGSGSSPRTVARAAPVVDRGAGPGTAVPDEIELRVQSIPPGAQVLDREGRALGVTPARLRLPRSSTPIQLLLKRAGHALQTVTVQPSRDVTVEVTLRKRRQGSVPDEPKGWGER